MTTRPLPSAVVFVRDVVAVSRFYGEVVGLKFVHGDEQHHVLEGGGFQLVVHELCGEPEVSHEASGRAVAREDTYIKLCFGVDSIEGARAKAASHGGWLRPREDEWSARGFRACDGVDVEGNVFQVRETANA